MGGSKWATSRKQTTNRGNQGGLHPANPELTSATSNGLHGIGTSQFSRKIRSLPGLTTHEANAGLQVACQRVSRKANGIAENFIVSGQITEKGKVNSLAAFGEFSLDSVIRDHQAAGNKSILVLQLFLLVFQEELGDKRNASEEHGFLP
jgi:hypothetical protein